MQKPDSILRVYIADHQEIFLEGLEKCFQSLSSTSIVGISHTDHDLVQKIAESKPDLIFLDAMLPHIQLPLLVQAIQALDANISIFVFYGQYNKELLLSLLSAGVNGIAYKYISLAELETAVYSILNGEPFFCAFTAQQLQQLVTTNRFHSCTKPSLPYFSDKEKTILRLLAAELTSKEIAEQLGMSSRTVESYRKSMQEKTGSKNSAGLILYAIKNGIIPVQEV